MGGLDPNLLTFLAGAGLGPLLDQLAKLMGRQPGQRNPATPSAQLPHRAGLRVGAGGPPDSTTIAPSMLQALLSQTQGPPDQQQMLAQLAQQQGGMPGI